MPIPYELVLCKDNTLIAEVKQRIGTYYTKKNARLLVKSIEKGMKMFIIKSVQPSKSRKKLIQIKINKFNSRQKVKIPIIVSLIAKINRNEVFMFKNANLM